LQATCGAPELFGGLRTQQTPRSEKIEYGIHTWACIENVTEEEAIDPFPITNVRCGPN
jgi:hypothetical protein